MIWIDINPIQIRKLWNDWVSNPKTISFVRTNYRS